MNEMDKRRLTVSLERTDYEALLTVAEQEERSLSWLIGRALKMYLQEHAVAEQLTLPQGAGPDRPRQARRG